MKRLVFILIFGLLFVPLGALAQAPVDASQGLQVEGLGINPFIIEVDAEPGVVVTRSIHLGNTTDSPLTFTSSINDFVPNGRTGQPLFLSTDQDSDPQFSLSRWITITKQPTFIIPAHGETEVQFTITPPADAEPGTHYGGILFGRPPGVPQGSSSAVQHKAGAIILVKLGKSQEQLDLLSFSADQNKFHKGPIDFHTVLSNTGNVHSKPKGEITIKNIVGGQILQIPINRDANIVLPQSEREFISEWKPWFAFGRYTAEAVLYYGNPKLELRTKITFWVIPVKEVMLGVLGLAILAIMLYIAIRKYNRYIIKNFSNEN
jgi:hypothetical protein